jgi:ABC-type glutathione transport system ATPase component
MAYALEVRDLWKSFVVGVRGCSARVSVLRGISFHVGVGECVGIVGRRGAGKTTLLQCIAGLRRPDRGSIVPIHPSSAVLTLVDDGTCGVDEPGVAALIFARDAEALRGRAHRVLLLRDGRLAEHDAGVRVRPPRRRVAEQVMPP